MTSVLSRLGSISDSMMPDRRRVLRTAVQAEVNVTTASGDETKANIVDISTHGCNLELENAAIRVGSFIAISLDSGRPLQAVVRWVRQGNIGAEFLRPMPADYNEWHDFIDGWQGN